MNAKTSPHLIRFCAAAVPVARPPPLSNVGLPLYLAALVQPQPESPN